MKTVKLTSLVLAGMMSAQSSLTFAQSDRTAGIGEQQAAAAMQQIADLRTQLLTMDATLAQTAIKIKSVEGGGVSDKVGMATAGLVAVAAGVGIGSYAILKIRGVQPFYGPQGLMAGSAVSLGLTFTSLISSLMGVVELPGVQTEKVVAEISKAQSDILVVAESTKNPHTLYKLNQLQLSLLQVENALAGYTKDQSTSTRKKLLSSLAMATGSAVVLMGHAKRDAGVPLTIMGSALSGGAGIWRMAISLEPSDIKEILVEIENTRQILGMALASLKN